MKLQEPTPPREYLKRADHHWLREIDFDGRDCGAVVLQWNPVVKKWSHSGEVGTGTYVDVAGWKYLKPCMLE